MIQPLGVCPENLQTYVQLNIHQTANESAAAVEAAMAARCGMSTQWGITQL